MSPILLLTGLMGLAYFGSMLVQGRAIRGFGLPSGTEFLLLGVLVGPKFLALFTRQGLAGFESLTTVGLAWLAFVIGSHYGVTSRGPVPAKRLALGLGLGAVAASLTGLPAALAAAAWTTMPPREVVLFGVATGAVSAETTRHAVRWVVERYEARGPVTTLVGDVFEADDALPLLLLALLAALGGSSDAATTFTLPGMPWSALAGTFVIGGAVGATCAALFDIEPRSSQRWGILLGTGLLTVGVSVRLGLSAVAAMFVMGVVARRLARERAALSRMLHLTERAVMLPALMLAGAYITLPRPMPFLLVAAIAIAGRLLAKAIAARVVWKSFDERGAAPASLALGLLPAGALSISVALAFELRARGQTGEWVLAIATLHVVVGEIVGPWSLQRSLRRAGEIAEQSVGRTPIPRPRRDHAAARPSGRPPRPKHRELGSAP